MMITWNSFLARRNISLNDIVKAYGLSYEQLCTYFSQRGVSSPARSHPEVEEIFGVGPAGLQEPVAEEKPKSEPKPPKKVRLIDASIKNTKKELLAICAKLQLDGVSDKMTKAKILAALQETGKVRVLDVKTAKRKK